MVVRIFASNTVRVLGLWSLRSYVKVKKEKNNLGLAAVQTRVVSSPLSNGLGGHRQSRGGIVVPTMTQWHLPLCLSGIGNESGA